ncbi:TPA: hypothetical protein LOL70_004882 [Salmonella enterica subsp. enterica serovar Infantis]|nr:hypothetical protein [Salmonella enterica subsp. enterica serovar Infantis]
MESRKHFEAWFEEWFGDKPLSGWGELWCGDGYSSETIDAMWESWQASRESVTVDLSKMHLLLCDQHDVVSELNKHGLKVKV